MIGRLVFLSLLFGALLSGVLFSCMEPLGHNPWAPGAGPDTERGVLVVNEGNFMYGNASLSRYDPVRGEVWDEVFAAANGMKLGDVAQSMVIKGGLGYVVVNNSGVIFVIDASTFRLRGIMTGFTSPRYIHFIGEDKAYVTQLWDDRIFIVNPETFQITGHIETGQSEGSGSGSGEQMVRWDKWVFTNCWSYDRRILVIDTETDLVDGEIEVGPGPSSLVLDSHGKIWTLTSDPGAEGAYDDGATAGDAVTGNYSLWRIDARSRTIEKEYRFERGALPSGLALNGGGDTLYYIDRGVRRMPVASDELPVRPFIPEPGRGTLFYALGVDPESSEIYVADAIDYVQQGVVYRYSPEGELADSFRVGITPGAFCFKSVPKPAQR